jgi:hypothetical protein
MTKSKLHTITTKLFAEDVRELKVRAKKSGVEYQVLLRAIVRNAVSAPKKVYKFLIPPGEKRLLPALPGDEPKTTITMDDCVATVYATNVAEGRALLERLALEEGINARWLAVATVVEIPLTETACRLSWSQR